MHKYFIWDLTCLEDTEALTHCTEQFYHHPVFFASCTQFFICVTDSIYKCHSGAAGMKENCEIPAPHLVTCAWSLVLLAESDGHVLGDSFRLCMEPGSATRLQSQMAMYRAAAYSWACPVVQGVAGHSL